MRITYIDTPLGKMRAAASADGICMFDFEYRHTIDAISKRIRDISGEEFEEGEHRYFDLLREQIDEYFAGTRKDFDLPLHLIGTPFQKRVWEALLTIPYGDTRSYEQQALLLGDVKAIRAVASANGENGIAIIVPCHRVIGKNGRLTGYGGGLPKKKWLLEHEQKFSGKGQGSLF